MKIYQELTQKTFLHNGILYKYWVIGDSSNPQLVIFYGYTGVYIDFAETCAILKKKFFIIIPEYPGWYGNPRFPEPLTIHNYTKFLKKIIDHIGSEKVNILGHCVGAAIAIEFALLYPQKVHKLILLSVPYLDGVFGKKFFVVFASAAKYSPRFIRPLFFFWRSRVLTLPLDFFVIKEKGIRKLLRIKNHITRQPKQGEDAVQEKWISYIFFDFTKVNKLLVPVHLIHGKKDLYFPLSQIKKFHKLVPSATLSIIPQAGHVPPTESPERLAKLVNKLLD